jgi:hypothetical protein
MSVNERSLEKRRKLMRRADLTTTLAAVSALFVAAHAGLALALSQSGSLGASSTATDFYHVTCSDDGRGAPRSLAFQVQNAGPLTAPVMALVHRDNAAMSTADIAAGDGGYSPVAFVNGAEGVFDIFVIKTADGASSYTLDYNCMTGTTGGGAPTGSALVRADGGAVSDSVPLVEYYNANLDHYFVTWMPEEIAILDAGVQIKGWTRTGKTLRTSTIAKAGASPVCRYYIPPQFGDSHFFGRGTQECTETGQKFPGFTLEDPAFMQMVLPVQGVCPAATTPVYRVFSNRADANHRYMTDPAVRDAMVALGWLAEGDGPDLVVMCAPQ